MERRSVTQRGKLRLNTVNIVTPKQKRFIPALSVIKNSLNFSFFFFQPFLCHMFCGDSTLFKVVRYIARWTFFQWRLKERIWQNWFSFYFFRPFLCHLFCASFVGLFKAVRYIARWTFSSDVLKEASDRIVSKWCVGLFSLLNPCQASIALTCS